jgi:hypothetical protein
MAEPSRPESRVRVVWNWFLDLALYIAIVVLICYGAWKIGCRHS